MSSRGIFRDYAKSKGKEAKEFVEIQSEMYNNDTLVTKSNSDNIEETSINYKDMVHWLISKYKLIKK